MVKKISAIILALVLCLSVMVVPVSALELGDADIAFELKWDKEYYKAGDTAYLKVFMKVSEDLELATGSLLIATNSAQITQDTTHADAVGSDLWDSFWKDTSTATGGWQAATITGKVNDANNATEQALYDQYLKIVVARNTGGSHDNAGSNKQGLPGADINALADAGEPIITFAFVVADGVEDGTKLNAAITTGSLSCSPAQTAFKYIKNPGTATTTANVATADFDVSAAVAEATFGVEPCETHTWNAGETVTAPTCGEAGEMLYTCTVCKSTKTEAIEATGAHTPDEVVEEVKTPASCSTAGIKDVVVNCAVCGAEISRTEAEIPATGEHNYATEVERVEPTCTADGYYVMACGCGTRDEQVVIPATGHDYDSVVTEPTCTEDGYTTYTCTVCQDSYTGDEVEATGHNYEEVVTAPTCIAGGYTTYTCTVCQDSYTGDEVEATGHNYEEVVTAPTCTEGGYTTYTCTVCQDSYTGDEVEATGHNYEVTYVKQPSCSKEGLTEYTCSICDDKKEESIPSKNHTYEDGSSALVEIPAVAPTCKNHGYTAGSRCALCNANVVTPSRVEATGHTKADGVVTEPTYFESGYTTYTCPDCGETFKDDFVDKKTVDFTFNIAEPTTTVLRARDTIILHPEFEGEVAEGVTVTWTADNENFKIVEVYEDGSVKVSAKKAAKGTDGITTFTATVVDAEGNEITSDTVELTANAKFFQQFLGFFRAIFGLTKNYEK